MSCELSPLPTFSQLWPRSRLRRRPSISTPAQSVPASVGSATSVVTRVQRIRGQSVRMVTAGSVQALPPSPERKIRDGQVPASTTSGLDGTSRIDQICKPLSGDSTRLQLSAPSVLRNSPCSLPSQRTLGL